MEKEQTFFPFGEVIISIEQRVKIDIRQNIFSTQY